MLMLTYAFVALSVEQKKLQIDLLNLQQTIQRERKRKLLADQRNFESFLAQFTRLDEAFPTRNIALYVLPALQSVTTEADPMLADVEALTSMGRIILKAVRRRMRQAFLQGSGEIEDLFNSLELYCRHLLKRLAIEEQHLLPLAQRVISSDEWFDIAARFISHESEKYAKKTFDHEVAPMLTSRVVAANPNSNAYQAVT